MPDSEGPGDHDITFGLPTAMLHPITGEASLAADALQTWIDLVPDTVSVSEPTPTAVAGWDAVTFDVVVSDAAGCAFDGRLHCVPFVAAGHTWGYFLRGFIYRVVWIDRADGPIVIGIGTTDSDPAWLEEAWTVIDTVEFG